MSKQELTGWIYQRDGVSYEVTGTNPIAENLVDAFSVDGAIKASFYHADVLLGGQEQVSAKAA